MKERIACFLLCLLMIASVLPPAAADDGVIRMEMTGGKDFRVLILADTQDTAKPQQAMLNLVADALDTAAPDLVVLLGDVIHGPDVHGTDDVRKAIGAVVSPIAERKIPFAVVFGNHDEQCGISKEEQMAFYREYDGCVAVEGPDLPGVGNYCVTVTDPERPDFAYALYFLDSGSMTADGKGYDNVKKEQIDWMLRTQESLSAKYAGTAAFTFQHIPVPQVNSLLEEAKFGTLGAVTHIGDDMTKWYKPRTELIREGKFGEAPCESLYDEGEFDAWKQMGLKAAFFGHDHLNDYDAEIDGIRVIATTGAGFYMYGRHEDHGARLLTLSASEPGGFDTRMMYYRELTDDPLPGFLVSGIGVLFIRYAAAGLCAVTLITVLIVLLAKRRRKKRGTREKTKK